MATPQVMAHRLTRLARSGGQPSAADQREWFGMFNEKWVAFNQSWAAMYTLAVSQQHRLFRQLLAGAGRGPLGVARALQHSSAEVSADVTRMLHSGLAPIHAKAMANARRLSRQSKT